MARLILRGDSDKAGELVSWAKSKLSLLKQSMSILGLKQSQRRYDFPDGSQVLVRSMFDQDLIDIYGVAENRLFVICYVGDTTADFVKKYYEIIGNTLKEVTKSDVEKAKGKKLIDDGAYGIMWDGNTYDDPFLYTYSTYGDGLHIPAIGKGIPAKQIKENIRYILTTQQEDEVFWGIKTNVSWLEPPLDFYFLMLKDSLCYAPYSIKTTQPQFNRYRDDEVIFNNIIYGSVSSGNVLLFSMYHGKNFYDSFCKIPRIYKVKFDGTKDYVELRDYADNTDAIISGYNYSADKSEIQSIIRTKTFTWGGDEMGEPIRIESYNMSTKKVTTGDTLHRCSDPSNDECFMLTSWLASGDASDDKGYTTDTGYETISDDVKLPFSLLEDGRLDYVRVQKHLGNTTHDIADYNTGIYCADELVEESGWKSVIQLYTDHEVEGYPAGAYAPILIFPVRYRPLHAYHSKNFNMLLYRKTVYNGYNTELLPYYGKRDTLEGVYQFRKTQIRSTTTYHIYVNGKRTDFEYQCKNMEYYLTTLPTPVGESSDTLIAWYVPDMPWADVNYDSDGNYLNQDNRNLTRIFSDSIGGKLLVGFDLFHVKFRNKLVYNSEEWGALYPEYDDSEISYMPNSDRFDIKDRKWLLFDMKGNYREITPPQKIVGENWQRVNGMCII